MTTAAAQYLAEARRIGTAVALTFDTLTVTELLELEATREHLDDPTDEIVAAMYAGIRQALLDRQSAVAS